MGALFHGVGRIGIVGGLVESRDQGVSNGDVVGIGCGMSQASSKTQPCVTSVVFQNGDELTSITSS